MAKQIFYVDIDLNNNQLLKARLENLANDPTGSIGRIYFNTTINQPKYYDGTVWRNFGDITNVLGDTPSGIQVSVDGNGVATVSQLQATGAQNGYITGAEADKLSASTNLNTASAIVQRDANGDFSARIGTYAGTGTNSGVTLNGTVTNPTDATTKAYVDALAQGLTVKSPVTVLATTNQALTGLPTIDTILLTAGQTVLLTGQTNPIENGSYVVGAGAWTRTTDLANGTSAGGAFWFVQQGAVYADTGWVCTTDAPNDIVGTDGLAFAQFSSAGTIDAGTGLSKTGNTIDFNTADDSLTVNANDVQVKRDVAGAVGLTASGIKVNVDASTIEIVGNNLQASNKVAQSYNKQITLGDGSGVYDEDITHNLGTNNYTVQAVNNATGEVVGVQLIKSTVNVVNVGINAGQGDLTLNITIVGAVGTTLL